MRTYSIAFIVLVFIGPARVWAGCAENTKTTIYYGNGINTDSKTAAKELYTVLKPAIMERLGTRVDPSCIEFKLAYDATFVDSNNILVNVANGIAQIENAGLQRGVDIANDFWNYWNAVSLAPSWFQDMQRDMILKATSIVQPNLQIHEALYKGDLDLGHHIIVVAHSQGNLYANKAYELVTSPSNRDLFHVVSVATPDDHYIGDEYFTLWGDIIAIVPGSLTPNISNSSPTSPCQSLNLIGCHSFAASYMSVQNGDQTRPAIVDAVVKHIIGGPSQYQFTTFDFPGANITQPNGINNSGRIVGSYFSNQWHGFLKTGSTFSNFDVARYWTEANAINDTNQVVGRYLDLHNSFHGFPADVPGAAVTVPYGINNVGQIVGLIHGHSAGSGYLQTGNTFTILPWDAHGINNTGDIVGWVGSQGYLRTANGNTTTFAVPGSLETYPSGINDLGQIVGWYTAAPGVWRGFLKTGSTYITFDGIATGINNAGQIVGYIGNSGFIGIPGTYESFALDLTFAKTTLSMTPLNGVYDSIPYSGSVMNNSENSETNLVLQSWITQGNITIAAGGVGIGWLTPGAARSVNWDANAGFARSAGMVAGPATLTVELRRDSGTGALLASQSVVITLTQ